MRNFSDKIDIENQNTHFIFNKFFSENCAVYEIMWKNMVQPEKPQKRIWRMHTACWITKATDTLSEYVIHIAFPWQHWLDERTSILCLYVHCLSCCDCNFAVLYMINIYTAYTGSKTFMDVTDYEFFPSTGLSDSPSFPSAQTVCAWLLAMDISTYILGVNEA
jgi:hypothetical protein